MANDKKNKSCALKKTSIGGQALMEGIMMRGPEKSAMAVRNAKGEIILETSTNKAPSKLAKIPFVRGIINMATSLAGGYKYLMRSADIALADAEEADKAAKAEKEAKKAAKSAAEATEAVNEADAETVKTPEAVDPTEAITETDEACQPVEAVEATEETPAAKDKDAKKDNGFATVIVMVIGVVLGVGLALGLFIFLPTFLYELLEKYVLMQADWYKVGLAEGSVWINTIRSAFEATLKILILVAYMFLVSLMKDIRRVFMYHGAEHKTIFCYEAGLELTVENVRTQRRFHPRCGTSFLILVLLVSLFIGIFIPSELVENDGLNTVLRSAIKILLLPVTIGIGYELIKLAGRKDNWFTRMISAPGVWLQHITTVEPDDSMIECAIAAMNEVIPEDKSKDNW